MTLSPAGLKKLRASLIAEADAAHVQYPQYAGHWDGWRVAEITRRVRTKMGVAFEPGDLVLVSPDTTMEKVPPRGRQDVPYDQWPEVRFATAYSTRNKINTGLPAIDVREVGSGGIPHSTRLTRTQRGALEAVHAGLVTYGDHNPAALNRRVAAAERRVARGEVARDIGGDVYPIVTRRATLATKEFRLNGTVLYGREHTTYGSLSDREFILAEPNEDGSAKPVTLLPAGRAALGLPTTGGAS